MTSYPIKVTYFKRSGKYYSEGTYHTTQPHMLEVMEDADAMDLRGELPGLVPGACREFNCVFDCSAHPHGFPFAIFR